MRAVNLIPADRGAGQQATSAAAAVPVYLLLAGLGALVVFALLWTVANGHISGATAKLATVNAEAQAAGRRAQAFAPYQKFAQLARDRQATVTSLSAARFDWAHGLREVARVVPGNVWLTGITGTSGAAGAAPDPTAGGSATGSAAGPRFDMTGCTTSQAEVARLMARLRAVDGVRSVELKTSAKPDAGGGVECPANKASDPVFTITVGFATPGHPKASVDATGQISTSVPSAGSSSGGVTATPAPVAPAASKPAKVQEG